MRVSPQGGGFYVSSNSIHSSPITELCSFFSNITFKFWETTKGKGNNLYSFAGVMNPMINNLKGGFPCLALKFLLVYGSCEEHYHHSCSKSIHRTNALLSPFLKLLLSLSPMVPFYIPGSYSKSYTCLKIWS